MIINLHILQSLESYLILHEDVHDPLKENLTHTGKLYLPVSSGDHKMQKLSLFLLHTNSTKNNYSIKKCCKNNSEYRDTRDNTDIY